MKPHETAATSAALSTPAFFGAVTLQHQQVTPHQHVQCEQQPVVL